MIVDVHAHAASEDFIRETAARPSYGMPYEVRADGSYATRGYGEMDRLMWDLDGRLENLHRRGIDLQLISPSPRTISDHEHVIGVEIARLMNRETANLVKRGGGRLGGMAVVPLGEPDKAADEIRWAVGEHGFQGHPGLRLALSHGGGTLPYLAGRLDLAYHAPKYEANPACRANITKPPSHYLTQFYYDTVVASPASLRFLIDLVGADRVMFGTDFPYEIGDANGAIALPMLQQLPPSQREKILGQNAREVLRHARSG
jgi:predicted TIM-barrel fold metal-dependent hydrolase